MSSQDKYLQCSDCGATFAFSAEEQELSQSRGFTNQYRGTADTIRQNLDLISFGRGLALTHKARQAVIDFAGRIESKYNDVA